MSRDLWISALVAIGIFTILVIGGMMWTGRIRI